MACPPSLKKPYASMTPPSALHDCNSPNEALRRSGIHTLLEVESKSQRIVSRKLMMVKEVKAYSIQRCADQFPSLVSFTKVLVFWTISCYDLAQIGQT